MTAKIYHFDGGNFRLRQEQRETGWKAGAVLVDEEGRESELNIHTGETRQKRAWWKWWQK